VNFVKLTGSSRSFRRICLLSGASIAIALPSISSAQRALEEVVVTAQKRVESLQDAPVAITAITGADLERSGGFDPSALSDSVPNLHVGYEGNRDGVIITMRGVSGTDVRNASDPTTALHMDGGYVARLSGANAYFYDIERIEVLRGPQGTLYGRNSTSGVVNVISKKPSLEGLDGDIQFTGGDYDLWGVKGAINVPLSDTVAARVSFTKTERDGYRDNGPLVEDGDDADEQAIRGHLLWEVSDNTQLLFTGEYYERGGVGQALAAVDYPGNPTSSLIAPNAAKRNPLDIQGVRDNSDTNFRFQLDHNFSNFDLFYQASFRDHERFFINDNDGLSANVNGIQSDSLIQETTDAELWTHEIRLSTTWDSPFQAIFGLFKMDEEINGDFDFQGVFDPTTNACPPNTCPWPNGFDRQSVRFIDRDLTSESFAVFLNTTYDISDSLTLTGGVRWTDDEKDKGGIQGDPINGSTFILTRNAVGRGPVELFSAPQVSNPSWTKTTWKLGLDYQVNDDWMIYATVGTGYKAGGYNRGSNFNTTDNTLIEYEPEEIIAYEAGFKADLLDGQARVNVAAFYYDYSDMQQASIFTAPDGTTTNVTNNAAEATIYGVEFEGEMLIGETGSASVSLGYLNTEFDEFTGVQDVIGASLGGLALVDVSGNDLQAAPEFTATLVLIPMTFSAFNGSIAPRVQVHYETDMFHTVLNRKMDERDGYTKVDASLFYEHSSNGWYAEAFVNNLTDEDVIGNQGTGGNIIAGSVLGTGASYSPPRQWGVRVGFKM